MRKQILETIKWEFWNELFDLQYFQFSHSIVFKICLRAVEA
jgi:hypothetical protein